MLQRPTALHTLTGGVVEYRHEPRGPRTVLICHGGHLRAEISLGEEGFADADWSVLVPSRPGYGRTPLNATSSPEQFADLIAELCHTLGITSVVALGISAGSACALALTTRHPELVEALVLASALSHLPWPDPVTHLASSVAFHPWWQLSTWTCLHASLALAPGLMLSMLLGATSTLPSEQVLDDLTPTERRRADALFRLMSSGSGFAVDLAHRPSLQTQRAVRRPTLVVASPTDGAVPYRHAQQLAENIPGAELWRSPSLSHVLWLGTGAAATQRRILEFAESIAHPAPRVG